MQEALKKEEEERRGERLICNCTWIKVQREEPERKIKRDWRQKENSQQRSKYRIELEHKQWLKAMILKIQGLIWFLLSKVTILFLP